MTTWFAFPLVLMTLGISANEADLSKSLSLQPSGAIGDGPVGEGFQRGSQGIELSAGTAIGLGSLNGRDDHDMVLASIGYAWTITDVVGTSHWYRGNWSLVGELFGGEQFNPNSAYIIGLTPLVRYSFATGKSWTPFVEAGIGPSFTDIGLPDLGGKFQFNDQAGVGAYYFWKEHRAFSLRCRYLHLSNAGFKEPNWGVNCAIVSAGASWFF